MSNSFGWAFIGAGTLGAQVAKEITKSGRHRIVSVYVRNPEKRAAFAAQYGALAAETPEQPVLCEKPVTTDAKQAAELIRLSRENNVYFTEGMWTWFAPVAQQIKAWYDAGEYGEIRSFKMNYHLKSIDYAPRVSDPNLAGGALLDITIYPITYAYRLLGKPERIECRGTVARGVDTDEEIALFYPNGVKVAISASLLDFKGLERLTLTGTKAKTDIRFFHSASSVKLKRFGGKTETLRGSGSMLNEFDLVAGEIREGLTESRFVPHTATLGVLECIDECRRQLNLVYPFEQNEEER